MKFALRADVVKRKVPPNGGWRYIENVTGWQAPQPMSDTFAQTVQRILRHRESNRGYALSVSIVDIEEDLMDQTAKRILNEAPREADRWVVPLDDEAKKKSLSYHPGPVVPQPSHAPVVHVGVVDRILARVRGVARGAATIADWLGEGCIPVSVRIAERRAEICAACPMNVSGDLFEELTGAIGESIREQTIAKNAVGLSTKLEDKLDTCDACGCYLRLKVWVPIKTIRRRLDDEQKNAMALNCWVRHEQDTETSGGGVRKASTKHVTFQRRAAFGDVIMATIISSKLREIGVTSTIITEPVIADALRGHPDVLEFKATGSHDFSLDKTYEGNIHRVVKDIPTMFLEAAAHEVKRNGIELTDFLNRVPVLGLDDSERWEAAKQLEKFPRPWVVVVDGSASWPNRSWNRDQIEKFQRLIPDATLIWSKPRHWVPAPSGFCSIDVRNFRHLMAIIAQADLVITPDTGPIHIAAAFNRPVVAIEQCNDTHLRLTNLTDYTSVAPALDCVRCGEFVCPKDPVHPPCGAVDAAMVAAVAKIKLAAYSNRTTSVLIPVLNYNTRLLRCIENVRGQVDEVMVIGDGNAKIPGSLSQHGARVIQATGKRIGYGKTIMRGARMSSGRFLLMLNDDCYLDPWAVEKMKESMTPGVAAVGSKLRFADGRIQHGGQFRPEGITGFGHIDYGKKVGSITSQVDMESVTFAAAMVRREAFFAVRGFDERYDCYSEDTDICLKLITNGWRVVYNPEATGIHEESQSTNPTKQEMIDHGNRVFQAKWKAYLKSTTPIHTA